MGPLPADPELVLDLVRRANRAIVAVVCRSDNTQLRSTHPRGVPGAVVDRAAATARLALVNDRPEVLDEAPMVVAAVEAGVAVALAFDGEISAERVDRARSDAWQLADALTGEGTIAYPQSRWLEEPWIAAPESLGGTAAGLCELVGRRTGRPVALALDDPLRGGLRVLRVAQGADPRLKGTSVLPNSAVARAVAGQAPVAGDSAASLFGHPGTDRRRAERQGLAFPVVDGRDAIGAFIVFGPPAALGPEVKTEVERLLALAAPRLAHLRALHFEETRARTDELTGLINRRGLTEAMSVWNERWRPPRAAAAEATLVILDLDHFKRLNDTFGHPAGDAALRHVAGVLRGALRDADVAARVGGEEFALWLPDTHADAGTEVAERVRAAVERAPVRFEGKEIRLTCSVGLAALPQATSELLNLYPSADAALYRAKRAGRNRVEVAGTADLP